MTEVFLRRVKQARAAAREAGRLLLNPTPDVFDLCEPYLAESIGRLRELESALCEQPEVGTENLRTELRALSKEIDRLHALMRQAAFFHLGWARLLATMVEGYNQVGEPAALQPVRRVSLEG